MVQDEALPLGDVVSEECFAQTFEEHGIDFGRDEGVVYTPAITLWGLISQVFYSGEQRSTKAAATRIAALWATLGRVVCSTNNGAYCKARMKIGDAVVRTITTRIAERVERLMQSDRHASEPGEPLSNASDHLHAIQAGPPTGRLVLADGFTVTAADTEENQEEYPQNSSQKEGLGFPILRCVGLICLTTGMLLDLAEGPYSGKETGETALLWKQLFRLQPGDILVADRYYCTYWILAACRQRGVHVVMRNHHRREDAPTGAKRISKYQRIATWKRPAKPEWMSPDDYAQMPASLKVRLVDVHVDQPGCRTRRFTVTTTLLDSKQFTREWITSVYGGRWAVELDIRSIKCSLGMDILRAKTPGMVRTELWSCLLAYNLIRQKILASALAEGRCPRSMSFAATMQMLATTWLLNAVIDAAEVLRQLHDENARSIKVGHRTGRIEPRANKRRPKLMELLTKPRHAAVEQLIAASDA